jgi:catechol 2,3-dioxygenase
VQREALKILIAPFPARICQRRGRTRAAAEGKALRRSEEFTMTASFDIANEALGAAIFNKPIDAGVGIGHVHLKVADIERALAFYCGVLGFQLIQRYGGEAAFISAGGYHHHIGLNTWESRGAPPPPRGTTGLYHLAILYPTRAALGDALRRLAAAGVALDGASDHGVSEALYLRDPDENGVELYWDRPKDQWPRTADGKLQMYTLRLDLESLLKEGA